MSNPIIMSCWRVWFGAAVYVYEKMNGGDYTEQQIPV